MNLIKSGLIMAGLLMIPGLLLQVNAQDISDIPDIPDFEALMQQQEVSGTYFNDEYQVLIDLPPGWSGIASDYTDPQTGKTVTGFSIMDGGFEANAEAMDQGIFSMIILNIMDKPDDKTPPKQKSPKGEEMVCTESTTEKVKVNGKDVMKMQSECTADGTSIKTRSYYYATTDKILILSYNASPASDFDTNIDVFEDSVATLTIENLVDVDYVIPGDTAATPEPAEPVKDTSNVMIINATETIVNATETIVNATETIVNATADTIEDTEVEEIETAVLPPLKQLKSGVPAADVMCAQDKELMIKTGTGAATCIKSSSVSKLVARGWGTLA